MDLRLRSNEASRPVARKPSGRRVFCLWASLAQSLQPTAGMLGLRRLAHSQNPSPQRPSQFSDRLQAGTMQLEKGTAGVSPALVGVPPTRTSALTFTKRFVTLARKNHRRDADGSDRDGRGPRPCLHRSG